MEPTILTAPGMFAAYFSGIAIPSRTRYDTPSTSETNRNNETGFFMSPE